MSLLLTTEGDKHDELAIAGSFSRWEKVSMEYSDQRWSFDLVQYLASTSADHQLLSKNDRILFKFIKNHDNWFHDPAAYNEDDGFGNFNNVIVVDRDVYSQVAEDKSIPDLETNEDTTEELEEDPLEEAISAPIVPQIHSKSIFPDPERELVESIEIEPSVEPETPPENTIQPKLDAPLFEPVKPTKISDPTDSSNSSAYGSVSPTPFPPTGVTGGVGTGPSSVGSDIESGFAVAHGIGAYKGKGELVPSNDKDKDPYLILRNFNNFWKWLYGILFVRLFQKYGLFGYGRT